MRRFIGSLYYRTMTSSRVLIEQGIQRVVTRYEKGLDLLTDSSYRTNIIIDRGGKGGIKGRYKGWG